MAVALPELLLPFGVLAALGLGFGLPEVAALTVAYVVVLEAVLYTPWFRRAIAAVFRKHAVLSVAGS